MICLSISLALLAPAADQRSEGPSAPPTTAHVRQAAEGGIRFLEKEGMAWVKKQGCAACHHIPLMVWALNEAKNQGYSVPERTLGEVTSWALSASNQAEAFPDLPLDKKRTEVDYLGPLFMALAVGAARETDASAQKERHRLLTHVVTQQEADGSWEANRGGRPPVHSPRDIQTGWLLLALSQPAFRQGAEDAWKVQREKAAQWLARATPGADRQALVVRLLAYRHLGKSPEDQQRLLESLLRQQEADGGWAQKQGMASDAFATGQALYVLGRNGEKSFAEPIKRAQTFLVRTQRPDGSWPMTSRPAEPKGPGPARNLRPISYIGTAWATLGLVRSSPAQTPGTDH
jgi:hypothetical protein